jgi:glycosyltransferase involved in cell wall biosynthesis
MMERLLFVSPEVPYPPTSGGRLRTLSLLKHLAQDFEIHGVTFAEGRVAEKNLEMLRPYLTKITLLPLQPHRKTKLRRYARNAVRALRSIPPLVDRFAEPLARRELTRMLGNQADWVWLEHLWLAPYVASIPPSATKVLDVHNVESDFYHQLGQSAHNPFERLGYQVFERAAAKIERRYLASFDRILAVSPEDRDLLARSCPLHKICIVPNAVGLGPPPVDNGFPGHALYFAGTLEYAPNRTAVTWFYQQVWPQVQNSLRDARWTIVGAHPELLDSKIRRDPNIILAGQVERAEPYLRTCQLALVPLTIGGGTRFKILEAWTAGKAVVSTSQGAKGLACRHGDNIWIANSSQEFRDAVLRVLGDRHLQARLGRRGWETVKDHYSLEQLASHLETALSAAP